MIYSVDTTLNTISLSNLYLQELEKLQEGIFSDMSVAVTRAGRLDAIAVWFTLHLDDDVTITTAPHADNCWEQAIYPVLPMHIVSKSDTGRHLIVV
jgi:hypothetical protein